jgi:serine/threonine-protein kinase
MRPDKLRRVEAGQSARGERIASGLAAAPRFLGRYRIVAELARGSTSVVYLGIVAGPGGFNKLFALKQLRAALAEDPANVAMFLAEARLAGRLSHSNVVSTLEIEEDSALPYIVMEYLEGQPLFRASARARMTGAPLSVPMQLAILSDAVEGLSYAHQALGYDGAPLCVVHRDVSPNNVFVTYGGQTKLLDFGIAQSREIEGPRGGSPRGKVAYMSPEQAAGMTVDARADIFAVGVMLWEAVTGQRFWAQTTGETQIIDLLAAGRSPTARESALVGVPPDLQYIIMNATEPDPVDRYESAAALQADLQVVFRRMAPSGFNHRDVGRRLSEIFADDRARLQAAIDTQLELAQGAGEGGRPIPWLSAHSTAPPPRVGLDGAMPPDVRQTERAVRVATGPSEPAGTLAHAGPQAPADGEARAAMQAGTAERDEPPTTPRSLNIARRSGRASNLAVQSPPPSSGIAPLRAAGLRPPSAWLDEAPADADAADDTPLAEAPSDPATDEIIDEDGYVEADDSLTPLPTEIYEPGHRPDATEEEPFGAVLAGLTDAGPSAASSPSASTAAAAGPAPSGKAPVATAPDPGLRDVARQAPRAPEPRSAVATLPSMSIPVLPPSVHASDRPMAAGTAVSIAPAGSAPLAAAGKWSRKQSIILASAIAGVIAAVAVSSLRDRGSAPQPAARTVSSATAPVSAPQPVVVSLPALAQPQPQPPPTEAIGLAPSPARTTPTTPTTRPTLDPAGAALLPEGSGGDTPPGNAAASLPANTPGSAWGPAAGHLGLHAAAAAAPHAPAPVRAAPMPRAAPPPTPIATPAAHAVFPTATAMPVVRPVRSIDVTNPYSP